VRERRVSSNAFRSQLAGNRELRFSWKPRERGEKNAVVGGEKKKYRALHQAQKKPTTSSVNKRERGILTRAEGGRDHQGESQREKQITNSIFLIARCGLLNRLRGKKESELGKKGGLRKKGEASTTSFWVGRRK